MLEALQLPQAAIQTGLPVTDLDQMLATLSPERRPGRWVYALLPDGAPVPAGTAALVTEAEGCTVVLRAEEARAAGLTPLFEGVWITLQVYSSLEAVGLMARVSVALAEEHIPANVLAGFCHDHLLVPEHRAEDALNCLRELQLRGPTGK